MPKKETPSREVRILAGNLFKEIKLKNYGSVREFCETKNISLRTCGDIVRGTGNPSLSTLIKISRALGVNLSKLFRD